MKTIITEQTVFARTATNKEQAVGSSICHRMRFGNFQFNKKTLQLFCNAVRREVKNAGSIDIVDITEGLIEDNYTYRTQFKEVETVCRKLGVTYSVRSADDCEFSEETWWAPGVVEPITLPYALGHGAMLSFDRLRNALDDQDDPIRACAALLNLEPRAITSPTFMDGLVVPTDDDFALVICRKE